MSKLLSNKKILIPVIVCIVVLLAVGIGVLITVLTDDTTGDTPDTGETFDQTYYMSTQADAFAGSSSWAFTKDHKVVNTYVVEGKTTVIEYEYVIAIEGGNKVIKLTRVDENGALKTTTHSFATGTWEKTVDGEKVVYEMISINDAWYTCYDSGK